MLNNIIGHLKYCIIVMTLFEWLICALNLPFNTFRNAYTSHQAPYGTDELYYIGSLQCEGQEDDVHICNFTHEGYLQYKHVIWDRKSYAHLTCSKGTPHTCNSHLSRFNVKLIVLILTQKKRKTYFHISPLAMK